MFIVVYGDEHGELVAHSFLWRSAAERFYQDVLKNSLRTFGPWIVEEG